jgi:DNA-binding NarL/FixJ family response regulator
MVKQAAKLKPVILVADQQFLSGFAVSLLISRDQKFELMGTVTCFEDLQAMLTNSLPDLLLIDPEILDVGGIKEILAFRQKEPTVAILVFTNQLGHNDINELNHAGIKNIIYKTIDEEGFWDAVDATLKKRKYYSDEIFDQILKAGNHKAATDEHFQLTTSEIEIVRQIANGLTTKEIANQRNLSFHTVTTHRKNIFRKLNINNTSELLMYAMRAQIISDIEYYI